MADRGPLGKFNECAENKTKVECAAELAQDAVENVVGRKQPPRIANVNATIGIRG